MSEPTEVHHSDSVRHCPTTAVPRVWFVSGFGQYHTNEPDPEKPNKKLTPYESIDLAGIRALVDDPQSIPKEEAQWLIPSTLHSRTFKTQECSGEYWMLWADLDKEPLPIGKVLDVLKSVVLKGCMFELYASRSATAARQKCRILIPLDQPLSWGDWLLCQEILNDQLEAEGSPPDRANQGAAQLCYLPNRGEFYDSRYNRDGVYFNPVAAWSAEIDAKRQATAAAAERLEILSRASVERRESVQFSRKDSLIHVFNDAYSVQEILLRAGYDQRGDTFRHPQSESGSYSASVKDGRVHSLSSNDPLYTGGGGVGAHDAFSAFAVLFAGGDTSEALKLAGDHWLMIGGESWNTVKRREHMQGKVISDLETLPEIPTGNKRISFDIDFPPGLVGEIAEYIFKSSRMPVRSFAVAGALSAVAYLNANKWYVGGSDTSLNLYQCLVGDTGKGKEDPRKAIKRLADAAQFTDGICESISSGPALLRSLESNREVLVLSDEFGIFLQVALTDKGSVHLKELVKDLLTLFGMGRSFFAGKRYADSKCNIGKIDRPYVNLLGTTTPLELADGITSKSIDNGFLNRILFVPASDETTINRSPDTTIDDRLMAELRKVASEFFVGALAAQDAPIAYQDGAEDLLVHLAESIKADGQYANLWARAEEQMIRVAGILAIGDGGAISRRHVQWSYRYVVWTIQSFSAFLGDELAETVFEKHIVKAKKIILNARDYSKDKQFGSLCRLGYMPRGKLTKLMKIKGRDLDDVINHLVDSKQVEMNQYDGSTVLSPVL